MIRQGWASRNLPEEDIHRYISCSILIEQGYQRSAQLCSCDSDQTEILRFPGSST